MTAPNFKDKTIWTGDNLGFLRGMNSERVDLIHLDSPFNSNKSYAAPINYRKQKHVLYASRKGSARDA